MQHGPSRNASGWWSDTVIIEVRSGRNGELTRPISWCCLVCCLCLLAACTKQKPRLTVGSKPGADQTILGEILAQHLEKRTGIEVVRRTSIGTTAVIHQSLLMADIDLYAETTGALVANILKEPADPDANVVLERVRNELARMARVQIIGPLGFDNPPVMVIRASDARDRKIRAMSEAAAVPRPGWDLAATSDFMSRPDGNTLMQTAYSLPLKSVPAIREQLEAYKLLKDGHVSMVAGTALDGELAGPELVVLEDDKKGFAPSQVCVVTRQDVVQRRPDLASVVLELKGKLTAESLRKLAFEHETKNRPVGELAAGFLAR